MSRTHSLLSILAVALTAHAAAQKHVIDLPITIDYSYSFIDVEVGTPPVSHRLLFDTGSSTPWIVSSNCTTKDCPNATGYKRTGYNVEASSTGRIIAGGSSIAYLGGGIGGPVAEDVWSFGNQNVTIPHQTFIDANQSSWAGQPGDGFIGFGFNTIAENGTTTIMHSLLKSGLLEKPEFAIYYGANGGADNSTDAVFTIGGNHEDKYVRGPIANIPTLKQNETGVNQYELWASNLFTMDITRTATNGSLSASNNRISLAGGERVVFDTGAGITSVPDFAIDDIYASIGWNYTEILKDKLVLPCSWFNASWSVDFTFEGYQTVRLYGDQLALPGFPAAPDACWPPFESTGHDVSIFGPRFLSQFYSVFDFGSFDEKEYTPHLRLGSLRDS